MLPITPSWPLPDVFLTSWLSRNHGTKLHMLPNVEVELRNLEKKEAALEVANLLPHPPTLTPWAYEWMKKAREEEVRSRLDRPSVPLIRREGKIGRL